MTHPTHSSKTHHTTPSSRTPVIKLENVTVRYGKGETQTTALQEINVEVFAGEYVIIFGQSGCGKSTLMNCIAGLERITEGDVKVRGASLKHLDEDGLSVHRRQKIGMVFQQFNVLRTMSVLENVALPQLFAGTEKQLRTARALKLLRILGLEKHTKKLPSELSGGQQQRVAIARALINNPWIILADEPTGNLDSHAAVEIMKLFYFLNRKSKRTIIMVTHNPEQLKFADRVIYMRDGKIIKEERKHRPPVSDDTIPDITSIKFDIPIEEELKTQDTKGATS